MTVRFPGRGAWIAVLAALGGCSLLVDGAGEAGPGEPEPLLFPPQDRNVVMAGHRVVDLDLDGQDDAAIINASTVPADRGVFVLLGGQNITELSYHAVVQVPATPLAIAFGEAIDGGVDGLEMFVLDRLGSLHVYTYVGGEQVYDTAPITVEAVEPPEPGIDTVGLDVGNFDSDPTVEAVIGRGNEVVRLAPTAWNQGAVADAVRDTTVVIFFDFIATVHEDDGTDSLLVGATDHARLYTPEGGAFDADRFFEEDASSGCNFLTGLTFVADRVEGSLESLAAVRTGTEGEDDTVCVTAVDAASERVVTRHWGTRDGGSPPGSRLGYEAIMFGDFTLGAAPELVVLDRSALVDSQVAVGSDLSYDADGDCFFSEDAVLPQVMAFMNPELLIPIDFDADGDGELWLFEGDGSRKVCQRWAPTAEANLGNCF